MTTIEVTAVDNTAPTFTLLYEQGTSRDVQLQGGPRKLGHYELINKSVLKLVNMTTHFHQV